MRTRQWRVLAEPDATTVSVPTYAEFTACRPFATPYSVVYYPSEAPPQTVEHYARYIVHKLKSAGDGDADAGYLKEKAKDWVKPPFTGTSYKAKRRKCFVGTI